MKPLLTSLVTTPERALRLIATCLDQGDEPELSVDVDGGSIQLSELGFPGRWNDEAKPFHRLTVWLEGAADQPQHRQAFEKGSGAIASTPEAADLLVATIDDLADLEQRWPRRLVVSLAEFLGAVGVDELMPLSFRKGTPAALPKELRGIWKQLKEQDVDSIDAGLKELSTVVAVDPLLADLLLTEVGVDPGHGTLILGNRFERVSSYSNGYLLYALLGVLSRSAPVSRGARIRQAVRRLEASCPKPPELRGFDSLLKLELSLDEGGSLAECLGPLPVLRTLHIDTGWSSVEIKMLDGLDALQLREINVASIGLTDMTALAGNACIQKLDLSGNKKLKSLIPLQACLPTLKSLDLSNTGITDLSVLSLAGVLEELNLDGCAGITSCQGLESVTISKSGFSLRDLTSLTSLEHLPHLQAGDLTLNGLKPLTTLAGLESRRNEIRSLSMWDAPNLVDLSSLAEMSALEELDLGECKNISNLKPLEGLTKLRSLFLRGCPKLKRLPDLSATSLEDLSLEDCAISDLGVLPASLSGSLNLVSLKKLKSLAGLERCSGLGQISIGPAIENASALAGLNEIAITLDLSHAAGYAIPEPLIETLAALPQVRLRIEDSQADYYYGFKLENPEVLARIPHLRTLDLSGCSLEDLLFVVGLAELEELKIEPRSELSRKLGGCTFEGRSKVAKVQLQLLGMS